ncbi:MAG: hypothetical protein WCF12_11375 [Propionicimonas sp.]
MPRVLSIFTSALLLVAGVAAPAGASSSDGPSDLPSDRQLRASWLASPGVPASDLGAVLNTLKLGFVPEGATRNSASTALFGIPAWGLDLSNHSSSSVTNAKVTVDSGLDPSAAIWNDLVDSFPVSQTRATLARGSSMTDEPLVYFSPITFAAGFDSTTTVSTSTIPVGGGSQTVTVTVTPQDERYDKLPGSLTVDLWSDQPGVSVTSTAGPANLSQGQELTTTTDDEAILVEWKLAGDRLRTGEAYTFTAALHVPNSSGVPFRFKPEVDIEADLTTDLGESGPDTTVSIADPTLDGGTAGRGGATFSVAETTHTWQLSRVESAIVIYEGTEEVVAPSEPKPSVAVKAVSHRSKLSLNVNPNLGKDCWRVKIQKKRSDGTWKTLKKTYKTKGNAETRTINLKKGTYRVWVKAQHGHQGVKSAKVRIKR